MQDQRMKLDLIKINLSVLYCNIKKLECCAYMCFTICALVNGGDPFKT